MQHRLFFGGRFNEATRWAGGLRIFLAFLAVRCTILTQRDPVFGF